jgi:hypothetical protein
MGVTRDALANRLIKLLGAFGFVSENCAHEMGISTPAKGSGEAQKGPFSGGRVRIPPPEGVAFAQQPKTATARVGPCQLADAACLEPAVRQGGRGASIHTQLAL